LATLLTLPKPHFQLNTLFVSILFAVGFPILFFFLWGEPYERGFFCDDESIRHPFHDSTVRSWMLYLYGIVLPIAIVSLTNLFNPML
jgi:phosphatidate phosphatase